MKANIVADDRRALAEALALARLSVAVARASTPQEVASVLLDEIHQAVPEATAAVAVVDEQAAEFELVGIRGPRTVEALGRWPFDLASPGRDVVLSKEPLALTGLEYAARYPEVSRIADPSDLAWYLAIPIVAGSSAFGAVGLSWGIDPALDYAAVSHLQSLVDAGAQALGRAKLQDAERRARSLLATVVDQMPLGVIIVEPSLTRPLYMNDAFFEIFAVPRQPEPAAPATQVLRIDLTPYPESERPLVRSLKQGEVVRDELVVLQPPGLPQRTVSVSTGPVRSGDGAIVGAVGIYSDVTARLHAEAAREAFLGVLSHELRTPITSIFASAEILRRRLVDDESRELADGVAEDTTRLHRLVEDLLVLTRVERGADLRRDDPVLVHHIVRAVADEAGMRMTSRIRVEIEAGVPTVSGDEAYVAQIVRNLLSNAAKYGTPGGSVVVAVRAEGSEVSVRVLDDGPGFEEGAEERAFDLFYRAPSTAKQAPGAGIGLYAVRALATAMGGRAWARNRPEGGAEVGVALPVYVERG